MEKVNGIGGSSLELPTGSGYVPGTETISGSTLRTGAAPYSVGETKLALTALGPPLGEGSTRPPLLWGALPAIRGQLSGSQARQSEPLRDPPPPLRSEGSAVDRTGKG